MSRQILGFARPKVAIHPCFVAFWLAPHVIWPVHWLINRDAAPSADFACGGPPSLEPTSREKPSASLPGSALRRVQSDYCPLPPERSCRQTCVAVGPTCSPGAVDILHASARPNRDCCVPSASDRRHSSARSLCRCLARRTRI